MPLKPVFLSAGVPDPKRDPKYMATADVAAIGEAVRALATVVLPRAELVFGGQPAISPLVHDIAQRLGALDRVVIYQSEHFRGAASADSLAFPRIVWTPDVPGDRETSLRVMREAMIGGRDFGAGVFIGGMEGVEDEFAELRRRHPGAVVAPVASTGAAAEILYSANWQAIEPRLRGPLRHERAYTELFRDVLGVS